MTFFKTIFRLLKKIFSSDGTFPVLANMTIEPSHVKVVYIGLRKLYDYLT